jgi:hypothetical protein
MRPSLRVPKEGPRRADNGLRCPGRTQESLIDDDPNRVAVRDNPLTSSPDERKWNETNELDNDVQAGSVSIVEMTTPELGSSD